MPTPFADDRRTNRIVIALAVLGAVAVIVAGAIGIAVLTAATYAELYP